MVSEYNVWYLSENILTLESNGHFYAFSVSFLISAFEWNVS